MTVLIATPVEDTREETPKKANLLPEMRKDNASAAPSDNEEFSNDE